MTKGTPVRAISLDMLLEILENGSFCHLVLGAGLEKYAYLEKQDRSFIRRLVTGTTERCLALDEVLDSWSRTPVKKMKPVIRTILRMSVYQILYMDRVPDSAAVNEAVILAGKRGFKGLSGFVNGLLRNISRNKKDIHPKSREASLCLPEWMISRLEEACGEKKAEEIALAFLRTAPLTVRINRFRTDMDAVKKSLSLQGVSFKEIPESGDVLILSGVDSPEKLTAFQQGDISIQDVSSVISGDAAGFTPGQLVLDVCGAPGGKALHAAELLSGTGLVVCRDISPEKTELIRQNIERSGLSNIREEMHDALSFDPEWEEKADVVIADLPCSGLGVIGRKPDIRYHASPEKIRELAALQRDILSVVWRYVKPGGTLVYSTCTISREENEDNRSWFLANYPFEPADIQDRLPGCFTEDTLSEGFIQILPSAHPADGFFISVMKRAEGKERL